MPRKDNVMNRLRKAERRRGLDDETPAHIDLSIHAVDSDGDDAGVRSRSIMERVGAEWRTRRFIATITPTPDAE